MLFAELRASGFSLNDILQKAKKTCETLEASQVSDYFINCLVENLG